ncbi:hypothetical protein [Sphingomonas pituitosa]|uniref:hypothetical protein n=1 Tax=Sphingomonas pituitosa TaxID=99597 RepID=UPI00082FB1E3|nr:hypothetical protein [Sphingomonas pituitosa]
MLVLWGLLGCLVFYSHATLSPHRAGEPALWNWEYYQAVPRWFLIDYAIGVGASLLGSLAMLRRSRKANILYVVSLAAVIVQFGYLFATGMLSGPVQAFVAPVFILGVTIFQIWLAGMATRRGWLR